jgi:hypothetical protein
VCWRTIRPSKAGRWSPNVVGAGENDPIWTGCDLRITSASIDNYQTAFGCFAMLKSESWMRQPSAEAIGDSNMTNTEARPIRDEVLLFSKPLLPF